MIKIGNKQFNIIKNLENEFNAYQYLKAKELYGDIAKVGLSAETNPSEAIRLMPLLDLELACILLTPKGEIYDASTYDKNKGYFMSLPLSAVQKEVQDDVLPFFGGLMKYITKNTENYSKAMAKM